MKYITRKIWNKFFLKFTDFKIFLMVTDLVSTSKIANFCSDALKEYTLSKEVSISCDDSDPCNYFLQGEGLFYKKGTHNQPLPTVILKNGYLLHFGILFQKVDSYKPKSGYYIKGISLQVFRDESLLFRAEWDNKDESETDHPQPHWHIEPTSVLEGKQVTSEEKKIFEDLLKEKDSNDFSSFIESGKTQDSLNFSYEKFHFAMSSCWHKGDKKCNIPLTAENLFKWLNNCMSSINYQLLHIAK